MCTLGHVSGEAPLPQGPRWVLGGGAPQLSGGSRGAEPPRDMPEGPRALGPGRPAGRIASIFCFPPKWPKKGLGGWGALLSPILQYVPLIFPPFLGPRGGPAPLIFLPIFLILGCCALGSTSGAIYTSPYLGLLFLLTTAATMACVGSCEAISTSCSRSS